MKTSTVHNSPKRGIKPLTEYLDAMAKTLAKVLVSGNEQLQMALDKILECLLESQPKSRQDDTKHDDILQSLLYQQEDMEKNLVHLD